MKWDKQVVVDAIRAYYDSIELTAWAKNPTDAVKRYWRSAQCKKGRVYAFVDYAKLMRAVDTIYTHSFVAANFVRKTIEDKNGFLFTMKEYMIKFSLFKIKKIFYSHKNGKV